jgi:phospholipid/cholesterol/gamma-HCH transport system ATP-binding protein
MTVSQNLPVLELLSALPFLDDSALPNARLELRLMPGDCALIESHDPQRTSALADLCSGMVALSEGGVRFMGSDWTELGREQVLALRGRIGRIYQKGAWSDMLGTHVNIMLPQLHHTRRPEAAITRSALALAREFGLPGMPMVRPDRLSEADLIRSACMRAFLGEPHLLLLETALHAEHTELVIPLLESLSRALDRGAAAICFTRDTAFWQAQGFPLSHRLHLQEDGLKTMRIR